MDGRERLDVVRHDARLETARVGGSEGGLRHREAEVLALAVEVPADLVLFDERIARRVAARFGLRFVGLLGVLVEAKTKGLVLQILPILDQLLSQAGFWIAPQLYADVLHAAGE